MRGSFLAALGNLLASAIPMAPPLPERPMRPLPEERPASRRRGRRAKKYAAAVYHEMGRFERKTRKFGPEYRPGKLFKGHRA